MSKAGNTLELTVAVNAVRAAARVTSRVQAELTTLQVRAKSDASPVSVGDYAAQAVVRRMLCEALGPELPLVAEESSAALANESSDFLRQLTDVVRMEWPEAEPDSVVQAVGANPADGKRASYWTLDPIDGTKGFLRNEHYAIALARIEEGQVTLAVLGCPRLDPAGRSASPSPRGAVLYVEKPGAVRIEPLDAPGEGLNSGVPESSGTHGGRELVPVPASPEGPIRLAKSVERSHADWSRYGSVLGRAEVEVQPVPADGQVKYALLALGLADVYLRVPRSAYREKVWDHAAGTLVAGQVGHRVSDLKGRPLDFGMPPHLPNPGGGLLIAPPGLHERLVRRSA